MGWATSGSNRMFEGWVRAELALALLGRSALNYREIAEARKMPGLRIVLGAYAIPGPWRESC